MKNILVAVEFENDGEILINKAITLADKLISKIWIIHVAGPDLIFSAFEEELQQVRDSRAEQLKGERQRLQKYVDNIRSKGVSAEALLVQGDTIDTILEEGEKLHAEMLIIGHHERSRLYKLFFGNTDFAVINKAKIPVLVVPV